MKKNGFTMVELLLAMVLGALIMAAVYGVMTMAQRTSAGLGRKIVTQQDARAVMEFMASEIRMASFNPAMSSAVWTSMPAGVADCSYVKSVVGAGTITYETLNRGILYADGNNLFIAMDLNGDTAIGLCTCADAELCADPEEACASAGGANEFLFYSHNSANRAITRSVSCSPNTNILGGTALGTNVINGAALKLFRYFDRDGNELTGTINIPAIRRIRITIAAETSDKDPLTRERRKVNHFTDVLVRNHAVFTGNY